MRSARFPAAPRGARSASKTAKKATTVVVRKESNAARKSGKSATKTMTLAQWLAVPDAPVQRDTERHWRKAKTYLTKLREAHYTVHMAVTEEGNQYKLDGHTRAYGWAHKLTETVPDYVTVIIHYVKDEEAVIEEYYTFDNSGQVKDASDQLFSAFKQFGIDYNSSFFKGCKGIVASMKEALWEAGKLYEIPGAPANLRRASVATCVQFFQEQLRALDSIDPTWARFSGPPTAAFLMAHFKYTELGKHVDDVVEFFRLHQNDAGVKNGKTHDAVYEVTKIMAKKGGGGAAHRLNRLAKLLGCVERFVGPGGRRANWQNGASVDMENYLLDEHALLSKNGSKAKHGKSFTR
jgi:hypothetical protein